MSQLCSISSVFLVYSGKKIEEGRITFKKPTKRASEGDSGDKEGNKSDEKRYKAEVQKANSKLLSFGDEEEEE